MNEQIAKRIIVNKIRSSWLEITKMYNEMAETRAVYVHGICFIDH